MPAWAIDVATEDATVDPSLLVEIEFAVRSVLEAENVGDGEISVALVGDEHVQRLHHQYLGETGPTDVISFLLESAGGRLLGDIYIGVDQARRQAGDCGIPLREELLRLAIHGTLHVLGWDHPADAADRPESEMYLKQEELLGELLRGNGGGNG
jgi:probable rRNA maturation factor